MNKAEAFHHMVSGRKVRHRHFAPEEWMTINPENGKLLFEDGCQCTVQEFYYDRDIPSWDEDYELLDLEEDEPKYLNLSSNEPYLIHNRYDADLMKHLDDLNYSHLSKKQREAVIVPVRTTPKIGRNEPCPCGSGKKNKHCHNQI